MRYDATLPDLLSIFIETTFGLAFVHKAGGALISLSDLLQLYDEGLTDTELVCKDVASPRFRLQNDATLKETLEEMIRRRIRRVFVNNSNAFISDRTAIDYIFSPEGIQVLRHGLLTFVNVNTDDELSRQKSYFSTERGFGLTLKQTSVGCWVARRRSRYC